MKKIVWCCFVCIGVFSFVMIRPVFISKDQAPRVENPSSAINGNALFSKIPLAFVENKGQWHDSVLFSTRMGDVTAWFEKETITLDFWRHAMLENQAEAVVRLNFESNFDQTKLTGETKQDGDYNYFIGKDASQWHAGAGSYASVLYSDIYPGINLRVREANQRLEYDLLLKPYADLSQVIISTEGVNHLALEPDGSLAMQTSMGLITQLPPVTWYELPSGEKELVDAHFVLLDEKSYTFDVPNRNLELAMVIDPGLDWSAILSGNAEDEPYDVTIAPDGTTIVVGHTSSSNFPLTDRIGSPSSTNRVFVTRLDPAGTLLSSTIIGGRNSTPWATEVAKSVAVDPQTGSIVIAGRTSDTDWPTTPGAFQENFRGSGYIFPINGFLMYLNSTADQLLYSTYLGDDNAQASVEGVGIAGDNLEAIVCGLAGIGFPTTPGAYDPTFNGDNDDDHDAFVVKIIPGGNGADDLLWGTYIGGSRLDWCFDLVVDSSGGAIIAGYSESEPQYSQIPYPTTANAFDTTWGHRTSSKEAFISRINSTGDTLTYSTYVGGDDGLGYDVVTAIAINDLGDIAIGGQSDTDDLEDSFGIPASWQSQPTGSFDVFLARLKFIQPNDLQPVWWTYLGGAAAEFIAGDVKMDNAGAVTVMGVTYDPLSFPTTPGAYQESGLSDVDQTFVSRFNPDGTILTYSSFLNTHEEHAPVYSIGGLALDEKNSATAVGMLSVGGFGNNKFDAVVDRIDMLPTGVGKVGMSTASCRGPSSISLFHMPAEGGPVTFDFANAPLSAPFGFFLVGTLDADGNPFGGTIAYIDLSKPYKLIPVNVDEVGYGRLTFDIPAGVAGLSVGAQFFFKNPDDCKGTDDTGGPLPWSASNALSVIVQ